MPSFRHIVRTLHLDLGMPTIGVAPGPNYYAVIRLDPISMVMDLGLDDPITLAEAKQMVTKRYLVYLHWVRSAL